MAPNRARFSWRPTIFARPHLLKGAGGADENVAAERDGDQNDEDAEEKRLQSHSRTPATTPLDGLRRDYECRGGPMWQQVAGIALKMRLVAMNIKCGGDQKGDAPAVGGGDSGGDDNDGGDGGGGGAA